MSADTSKEAVERRAARIERYAEQRRAEAGNWAPGSTLHAEVLAHAEVIAGDAATLRALAAERDALKDLGQRHVDERDAARAERDELMRGAADREHLLQAVQAERDAARAEADIYRTALADLLSWQDAWPRMARQLAQEGEHMQAAVTAARAALAQPAEAHAVAREVAKRRAGVCAELAKKEGGE